MFLDVRDSSVGLHIPKSVNNGYITPSRSISFLDVNHYEISHYRANWVIPKLFYKEH